MNYEQMVIELGGDDCFGILAGASGTRMAVYARSEDFALGDLFLVPSTRGTPEIHIFRMTGHCDALRADETAVSADKDIRPGDFAPEKLVELSGVFLGCSRESGHTWQFVPPRRLPERAARVYHIGRDGAARTAVQICLRELLHRQIEGGIYLGDLLVGETPMREIPVCIPGRCLSRNLGIFGRGTGDFLRVLMRSVLENNRRLSQANGEEQKMDESPVSLLVVDPLDELGGWRPGAPYGLCAIAAELSPAERKTLLEPFCYLSARRQDLLDAVERFMGLGRRIVFHRRDLVPDDLVPVLALCDRTAAAAVAIADEQGEHWIGAVLNGKVEPDERVVHRADLAALNRRLSFLAGDRSELVPKNENYVSCLAEVVTALDRGRVLVVDTSLMSETEQHLLTVVTARVIFGVRRALHASCDVADFLGGAPGSRRFARGELDRRLHGMASFKARFKKLVRGDSPYLERGALISPCRLPVVDIVVAEAPHVLSSATMREIARYGEKFGVGLTVVARQITEIDPAVLGRIDTGIFLAPVAEAERRALRSGVAMRGLTAELPVLDAGQAVLSAGHRSPPLPLQLPEFPGT